MFVKVDNPRRTAGRAAASASSPSAGASALVLAVALRGVLESLLVDVSSGDPRAYLLAASCLTVVAVAAALIPAMRAARMNPLEALRES